MALTMEQLASRVRVAMAVEDLSAFGELLHPDVTWGAPGAHPGCKSRNQVLVWYQRGREAGVRGSVFDIEIIGDRPLVSMSVRGTEEAQERGGTALRYQVLTVRNGRVIDIVGFDDKAEAFTYTAPPRKVTTVVNVEPIFSVADVPRAVAHYERLGFTTSHHDETYAFAHRDNLTIHLAQQDGKPMTGALYMHVDDADELANEWRLAGIELVEPKDFDYGKREGSHRDPDGNLIRFGSPLRK